MVSGSEFAIQACSSKYDGLTYDKADCQKFVERVLSDCGVKKPDGKAYDWKGANSMWRNALAWKGTVQECIKKYGSVPLGAWVFIHRYDGGEKERGYNDNEGNAKHVGIYVGDNKVRDSTESRSRNGVGYRELDGFNMVGLPKMITYNSNNNIPDVTDKVTKQMALDALATLTKYIKGE